MQHNAEMQREGNAFLQRAYPRLSTIISARLVADGAPGRGAAGYGGGGYGGGYRGYGGGQAYAGPAGYGTGYGSGYGSGYGGLPEPLQESQERLSEMWQDRQLEQARSAQLGGGLGRRMRGLQGLDMGLGGGGPSGVQRALQAPQIMEADSTMYYPAD